MGSLCLGRSLFSTWIIHFALPAVFKRIGKQMLLQERPSVHLGTILLGEESTSLKVLVNLAFLGFDLP